MSEAPRDSRTEAPSPRRREQARRRGDVAVSAELGSGLMLLAGAALLLFLGSSMGESLRAAIRDDLRHLHRPDYGVDEAALQMREMLLRFARVAGVFLGGLFVAALTIGVSQVGIAPSLEILSIKWERLSPQKGLKRIFSLNAVVRGVLSVLKVAIVGGLAWWFVAGRIGTVTEASGDSLGDAVGKAWTISLWLCLAVAAALTLLGVLDYLYQRRQHEESLKMTKEERKEELKDDEGDPQVKKRIRQLQRDAAASRSLSEVPEATVIITNPTHLAIALRYGQLGIDAPRVIAKGAEGQAERIVAIARKHSIPIVQKKPLAQVLFKAVKVNQQIPAALYRAVAEVLAYVHKLRGELHDGTSSAI